jgi:hypothetical protein
VRAALLAVRDAGAREAVEQVTKSYGYHAKRP